MQCELAFKDKFNFIDRLSSKILSDLIFIIS